MNRLLIYLGAACFAFTFSSIFYYLFRVFGIFPQLTEQIVIHLFLISCSITLLIYLSHLLPVEHPLLIHLLEVVCVLIVLIVSGAVFGVYPFSMFYVLTVVLCGICAYTFVMLLVYLTNVGTEKAINQAIIQQKRRDSE